MTDPIRAKIVEAVPEIMKLGYGCEIYPVKGNHENAETILDVSVNHPSFFQAKTDMSDGKYLDYPREDWNIIGRPITLADVLRAIQLTGARWTLSDFGLKVISSDENGVYEEIVPINLALDFDQQEDEVKQFIGRVLGVTE